MEIYFAPMEGITGYLYRNVHNKYYNGIAAYYAPFITTTKNGVTARSQIRTHQDIGTSVAKTIEKIGRASCRERV